MKLRYITCSDPREHNSIKSIIDLAHLPHAEVASLRKRVTVCHEMFGLMIYYMWLTKAALSV